MGLRRLSKKAVAATLGKAVAKAINAAVSFRVGEVNDVDTGAQTLTATIGGTKCYAIPYMASYSSPAEGDVVWCLHFSSTLVAIGKF